MRSLKRLFWVSLIIAAFLYGFIFGSEQISIADVQVSVCNGWQALKDPQMVKQYLKEMMDGEQVQTLVEMLRSIFE